MEEKYTSGYGELNSKNIEITGDKIEFESAR